MKSVLKHTAHKAYGIFASANISASVRLCLRDLNACNLGNERDLDQGSYAPLIT